jgi:hypothetical protein
LSEREIKIIKENVVDAGGCGCERRQAFKGENNV